MKSDEELLDAWRGGDSDAGEVLFSRYFDPLYRFFGFKIQDSCEELVQATFAACIEKKTAITEATSFRALLFGFARIEVLRYVQRKHRRREVDLGSDSIDDLATSPSRLMAKREELRLLAAALRRIPIDLQIVIELHYWEGLTTRELRQVLQIPEGTVKSRLRRARECLEQELQRASADPGVVGSTLSGFDRWVLEVRDVLGPNATR